MRVIHISVKTEETQILRIEFVLVLSYLNSNTTSVNRSMNLVTNKSTILSVNGSITLSTNKNLLFQLSTNRHIWPHVDNSTLGYKARGLQRIRSHSCLAVDNPNKDEEELDIASLRARTNNAKQVKDEADSKSHFSIQRPSMYSHTRRAAHFLHLMTSTTPSSEDDLLSRPAKKQ